MRVSTRLLEALVEAVKQHRQQVNAVGKESGRRLARQSSVRTHQENRRPDPEKIARNSLPISMISAPALSIEFSNYSGNWQRMW